MQPYQQGIDCGMDVEEDSLISLSTLRDVVNKLKARRYYRNP